jgi:hypothetical protein
MSEEAKKSRGWSTVDINDNLSVKQIISFLNILNNRLVALEDNVTVRDRAGKIVSVSDYYEEQVEEQQKAQIEAEKAQIEAEKAKANAEAEAAKKNTTKTPDVKAPEVTKAN